MKATGKAGGKSRRGCERASGGGPQAMSLCRFCQRRGRVLSVLSPTPLPVFVGVAFYKYREIDR